MRSFEILSGVLWTVCSGMVIYGSMMWLLYLLDRKKPNGKKTADTKEGKKKLHSSLALGNAIVITVICEMEEKLGVLAGGNSFWPISVERIILSLLAGGLLAAACMDAEHCYVYNYVWWWSLLWTVSLLMVSFVGQNADTGQWGITDRIGIRQAAAVALFVLLQQYLFARMYGRADSHAFSVCALAMCRWRGEMLWFLIHMLLAVSLLAVVQLSQGNVTRRGRLRIPKPFIPYIITTFWAEILWMLCLQGGMTHIYT